MCGGRRPPEPVACLLRRGLLFAHFTVTFVSLSLPAELLAPRHEAAAGHDDHVQQLPVLAGVGGYVRVRVPGRQGLPELLLLLRGVQVRLLEERANPHRHLGAGLVFPRLLPHVLPALQPGLLGRLPVPLSCRWGGGRHARSPPSPTPMHPVPGHPPQTGEDPWGSRGTPLSLSEVPPPLRAAWENVPNISIVYFTLTHTHMRAHSHRPRFHPFLNLQLGGLHEWSRGIGSGCRLFLQRHLSPGEQIREPLSLLEGPDLRELSWAALGDPACTCVRRHCCLRRDHTDPTPCPQAARVQV